MTFWPQRVAGVVRATSRHWRAGLTALRPTARQVPLAVAAVLAATVVLVPWSWWREAGRLLVRPGWRWPAILLLVAGLAALAQLAARMWSRSSTAVRGRPVAARAPLFVHVTVLLLIAVAVAVALGTGMWLTFGRPQLSLPATTPPASTPRTATAPANGWTVQNTFDAMKIVLSVVAGIGGVVALTVAYRKQGHSEAAEHREDTKLFTDRFGKAADELGSDKAAVRLAGVYTMAGLADDWIEGRQTCIDVLCAYLRMPYTPPPPVPAPSAGTAPVGLPLGASEHSAEDHDARQEQQVRHTVLDLIREHLQPPGADDRPRWHGHRFNLNGAVFDGGSLRGINITAGTALDCTNASFSGGPVDFSGAEFSGGTVTFDAARFSGGTVTFAGAEFSGGTVTFGEAEFSGSTVDFGFATFSRGTVNFGFARFSAGTVDFAGATFSGATVNFGTARFSGGAVNFAGAEFSGGEVTFAGARFSDGEVTFVWATVSGGTLDFAVAEFSGGTVTFSAARLSGGTINFDEAEFSGGTVTFSIARLSGGTVNFDEASFSGGSVRFDDAEFSGARVDLAHPQSWQTPPAGAIESERGVQWPSAEHLADIRDLAGSE